MNTRIVGGTMTAVAAVFVLVGSLALAGLISAPAGAASVGNRPLLVSTINCNKGGSINPLLLGSGIAGGASCTLGGFDPSSDVTVTGGLHHTTLHTNVDGVATGTVYSDCTDTVGSYPLTFATTNASVGANFEVAANPNLATDCPTTTTTTAPASTTTTAPAAEAAAVTAQPTLTG